MLMMVNSRAMEQRGCVVARVQVLLSTYNGGKYLQAQIDSLLQQTYADSHILVRDDGSKDSTHQILQQYESEHLTWYAGDNVGVIRSFMDLLRQESDAQFYAFCDQDDVWKADKIERAVTLLDTKSAQTPLLYFTHTELVNHQLQPYHKIQPIIEKQVGFGNALVQNIVTGCTAVLNRAGRDLLLQSNPNWDNVRMHDWWA